MRNFVDIPTFFVKCAKTTFWQRFEKIVIFSFFPHLKHGSGKYSSLLHYWTWYSVWGTYTWANIFDQKLHVEIPHLLDIVLPLGHLRINPVRKQVRTNSRYELLSYIKDGFQDMFARITLVPWYTTTPHIRCFHSALPSYILRVASRN